MAKPEQVLIIEPQSELKFRGPFSAPVTSYMKLTNPTEKRVMFKIKTTAPKKYCVRPNSGALDSNGVVEIAICLQPFIFDPNEKNKHKFMVQTVFAPDGDVSAEQVWKDVPTEKIMDSKLKCVFEVPAAEEEQNGPEIIKASPKSASQPSVSSNVEDDLKRAKEEVIVLREEESALRQENLRLKEDMLRLKQMAGVGTMKEPITSKYFPPQSQNQGSTAYYMAIGLFIAIFGIIVGKFVL
ncbi:vesicle-associated membrane protein-associated protein B/C-like [Onthophagus taurus]|uniref:vesicle-associated membrane protein-associated protein B/C-like n=1 Tax=Onthophagus taurus TaxID=166361 RepID=UPI000C1FF717|nr:vesicle-associated membrane protein-associated protein B/C-like [Onthophagus taurus]